MILRALSGGRLQIGNLSDADDTRVLAAALESEESVIDIGHAGTAMRFLAAFMALSGIKNRILTGSTRMQQRPIGPLVEALRQLGAQIEYTGAEGYPPLQFRGYHPTDTNKVTLDASLSSQYASALVLGGAGLPTGLIVELKGNIASRSYLDLTLNLMAEAGIKCGWFDEQHVYTFPWEPEPKTIKVEGDWSAASYWFAACGISGKAITLSPLRENSLQPDRNVVDYFASLGVAALFEGDMVHLTPSTVVAKSITIDFVNTPDIAQTLMVYCAAKDVVLTATGLETLRIKETDRISAMQQELAKFGCTLEESRIGEYVLTASFALPEEPIVINTYHDHRMALAFAPLQLLKRDIAFKQPEVVTKSYPQFWEQWEDFLAGLIN